MKQVIMTKGLPGCGKSTWAKSMQNKNPNTYKRVNKDSIREMLDNNFHNKNTETFIEQIRDNIILLSIEQGYHVIVDDTNLSDRHYNRIKQLVKGKATVIWKDFTDITVETCIKQDLKRPNSVGEKVIREMYDNHLKPKPKQVVYNPELHDVVICDLDGTLALMNGRNPFDASDCYNDLVNEPVVSILKNYENILFVSGRHDKYQDETRRFIEEKCGITKYQLLMRKSEDFRKDSIVKQEIYDNEILNKYNVLFVLDDRNQVVDMWRENGLTCLQVAPGNF